jgi:hypothetical protein
MEVVLLREFFPAKSGLFGRICGCKTAKPARLRLDRRGDTSLLLKRRRFQAVLSSARNDDIRQSRTPLKSRPNLTM